MIQSVHRMPVIAGILAVALAVGGCGAGQADRPPVTPGATRTPGMVLPVLFDDDGSPDSTAAPAPGESRIGRRRADRRAAGNRPPIAHYL